MSLTILDRGDRWHLKIENEIWEIPNRKELMKIIDDMIKLKEKYGRLQG